MQFAFSFVIFCIFITSQNENAIVKKSHCVYQTADVAGRQYIIPSTVVKQQEPDLASQPSQACLYPLTYGNKI